MNDILVIPPSILWIVLAVAIFFYAMLSASLMYHWKQYSAREDKGRRFMRGYFFISGAILLIMIILAFAYGQ